MVETYTNQALADIFKSIDKDKDGYINRQDLESTDYAQSLFEGSPAALNVQYVTLRLSTLSTTAKSI